MIEDSSGLSQAGLSRLNQSIEAFVYSILGAQVNVRSSILGNSGSAKEAQTEFDIDGRCDQAARHFQKCSKISTGDR